MKISIRKHTFYVLFIVMSLIFTSCAQGDKSSTESSDEVITTEETIPTATITDNEPVVETTVVEVDTAYELLNSINDNTIIKLTSYTYNLSTVTSINNSFVQKQTYNDGYVIYGVKNLTIEGYAEILIDDKYADVLSFDSCSDITLDKLTVGHSSDIGEYQCDGAVISANGCTNLTINDCNLFGCGSIGLDLTNSSKVLVNTTNIYDCNFAAVSLWGSTVQANSCNIYDISTDDYGAICKLNESTATFDKCTLKDNLCTTFIENNYRSTLSFSNCTLNNNSFEVLTNDESGLAFSNCTLKQNTGAFDQESAMFTDCKFEHNSEMVIPNVIGMNYTDAISTLENAGINVTVEYSFDSITTDCLYPSESVVDQNVMNSTAVTITVAKAAVTIKQINIDINTANGVEPEITYTNNTDKQIAYIYINVKFYDRMGYPAVCSIKNTDEQSLKITGPINAGITDTSYWDAVIYNSATAVTEPLTIRVEFTDGETQTITNTGRHWYTGSYYGGELHK